MKSPAIESRGFFETVVEAFRAGLEYNPPGEVVEYRPLDFQVGGILRKAAQVGRASAAAMRQANIGDDRRKAQIVARALLQGKSLVCGDDVAIFSENFVEGLTEIDLLYDVFRIVKRQVTFGYARQCRWRALSLWRKRAAFRPASRV